jgi:5-(carboxyamino)imidazole ribonucleotide synthase
VFITLFVYCYKKNTFDKMPKYDIGIIGGGQLGKMLIEEGIRYNVSYATLDPEANSPASPISHHHITGSLNDAAKIEELVQQCKVTTYEIEHINIEAVKTLADSGHKFIPSPNILEMVQDKGLQKQFYAENNIPTSPFVVVNNSSEWLPALHQNNFIKFAAKLRRGGYDGKGVVLMQTSEIENDSFSIPFNEPCVLESFVNCTKEISVIVSRDLKGNVQCFDPVEMEFDEVANLVTYLICPAQISNKVKITSYNLATKIVNQLDAVGIFAIELFVLEDETVLVNEMAPRPHNSGHHTIEGCYTSQYEQLNRILLGKPLGDTSIAQPSAMINILGSLDFSGPYILFGEDEILKMAGVYIHMYGKAQSKPNRKLGHITIIAPTAKEVKEKADYILKTISIQPN